VYFSTAVTYYRYYLEPSVVKNNGSVRFSPTGSQTHSHTSTRTHAASVTTTVTTPTSDIKPLTSLLGSQGKSLKLNVQVSHDKLPCTGYVLTCMLDMLHWAHICIVMEFMPSNTDSAFLICLSPFETYASLLLLLY
jgi:hypothetical protein